MSAADRLADHLRYMIEGARDVMMFIEGMDRRAFMDDLRTQRAVLMSLMIVGEAAGRVLAEHPTFAEANPAIPWRAIRGMRNRIAHGYFDVDLGVVWRTVEVDLPALVERLSEASGGR